MQINNYTVQRNKVKFSCPNCGERLATKIKQAGTKDSCPSCGTVFICAGQAELGQKLAEESDRQKQKEQRRQEKLQEKEKRYQEKCKIKEAEEAEINRLRPMLKNKERELMDVDLALHKSGYYRAIEKKESAAKMLAKDSSSEVDTVGGCLLIFMFCSIVLIPIALLLLFVIDNGSKQAKKTRNTMIFTSGVMDVTLTPHIENLLSERNELQAEVNRIKSELYILGGL